MEKRNESRDIKVKGRGKDLVSAKLKEGELARDFDRVAVENAERS
jgi:hypothetical protein